MHARPLLPLVLLLAVASPAGAQEKVGAVAALEGRADVRHRDAAAEVALAGGADVLLGDRLRTFEDARLKVLLRDDSVLTLGAESELTVDEQRVGTPAATTVGLAAGAVRAVVRGAYTTPGAHFDVQTPTAVAGVRGTTFQVSYDPRTGVTEIVGIEGTVVVRGRGTGRRVVKVTAGHATRVPKGGVPGAPKALDPAALQQLLGGTDVLSGGRKPEAELGMPRSGPQGAATAPAITDPRRPDAPGPGNLSPDAAVDQPVQRLRQLPPPGPPSPPPGPPKR